LERRAAALSPLDEVPAGGKDDHRGEQTADLADDGDDAEASYGLIVRANEREVAERRREAAQNDRAAGGPERAENVRAAVGVIALHHVHAVVDADTERDRQRREVHEVDAH